MGPLGIELFDKIIKLGLLLQEVGTSGFGGGQLEGEMHALMPTILLRVARFNAFKANTQPQPPDRQLREIEQGIG